jgi:hypothetical protein
MFHVTMMIPWSLLFSSSSKRRKRMSLHCIDTVSDQPFSRSMQWVPLMCTNHLKRRFKSAKNYEICLWLAFDQAEGGAALCSRDFQVSQGESPNMPSCNLGFDVLRTSRILEALPDSLKLPPWVPTNGTILLDRAGEDLETSYSMSERVGAKVRL